MKVFLESAHLGQIKEAVATGLVDGVVTDPALIAKESRGFEETVRDIAAIAGGPVSAEAVSEGWEELVEEGRSLAKLHKNVVVKLPLTAEGLRAMRRLAQDGVKTNGTHCFTPVQALLASKSGAAYVSINIGRIDELGEHGGDVVEKTLQVFNNYDMPTQVVVTGTRSPIHVLEAALVGADCVSVSHAVFQQMIKHPMTDAAVKQYLDAWKKVPKN